ncbi:MAG: hypothetical protein ACI9T9_003144, partial [Oleiphilaceae bacterium]
TLSALRRLRVLLEIVHPLPYQEALTAKFS